MSKDFFHQLPLFLDYSAQVDDEFNEFVGNQADRILLSRGLSLICGLRSSAKTQFIKALFKEARLRELTTCFIETNIFHNRSAFEKAGTFDLVCIDNFNEVCGIPEWEL